MGNDPEVFQPVLTHALSRSFPAGLERLCAFRIPTSVQGTVQVIFFCSP